MLVRFTDFNGADTLITERYQEQWNDLNQTLSTMPLHLKASDQAGIQGNAIFDPVGTNHYISAELGSRGWRALGIPIEFRYFGTGVDFGKRGVIAEVQFSNYPFLANNILRSELFYRSGTVFDEAATGLSVVVTKAGMFPSSNSTLYYEQAFQQLTALANRNVFTVPLRLIGLFADLGIVNARWTEYTAARYSRTVAVRNERRFTIEAGRGGRCRIVG
jgi:hypothetical protein